MDLKELVDQIAADGQEWFPEVEENIAHTTLGLVGETGEVADLVKKYERFTLNWTGLQYKLPEEIVDVVVYALKLASQIDMDFESEYHKKRDINKERFGHKAPRFRTRGRGNGS